MRMQITFKSGAQVEFEALELSSRRHQSTGKLVSLEWKDMESAEDPTVALAPELLELDVDEVVAIVRLA